MKRTIYSDLLKWKTKKNRKPLLLKGARQVGKTYILKEFGKKEFNDLAYFNFEEENEIATLFEKSLKVSHIIESLELFRGKKIDIDSTLIFFDEIQAAPRAITSLKYFCEEAPEYHVVSAGSLLGVSAGKQSGFPVGKVNFMNLYPMSFMEYLLANENDILVDHLLSKNDYTAISQAIHDQLISYYKMFLFLGGMPEVIARYLENRDIEITRQIQNEILNSYEQDFSKYSSPATAIRVSEIWNSIPAQLAKENKKFKYRDVTQKGRASMYREAIEWLRKAGLIYLSYNIKTPKLPLAGYYEHDKFKLFMFDTGLLGAKLKLTSRVIVSGDAFFSEYNGAFIENYTAIELVSKFDEQLCYWTSQNEAEVDFILNIDDKIYPIEVKSGYSKRMKSLRVYSDKYEPEKIIRTSPRNFIEENDFCNIPLYSISTISNLL